MSISKSLVTNNSTVIPIGTSNTLLHSASVTHLFVMSWWVTNTYHSTIGKLGVFTVQFYGHLVGVSNLSVIDQE